MQDKSLHHLIGDIYDASLNPDKWDALIRQISCELSDIWMDSTAHIADNIALFDDGELSEMKGLDADIVNDQTSDKASGAKKNSQTVSHRNKAKALSEILNHHFNRAYSISEKINLLDENKSALETALDFLTIPVIIINNESELLFSNKQAHNFISRSNELEISNRKITLKTHRLALKLQQLISTTFIENITQTMQLGMLGMGYAPSLVITPLFSENSNAALHAAIFISSHDNDFDVSEGDLKRLYGITKAETRLINHLVKGDTLKEVSEINHVSMSTLRSQLKSVFAKTGISRQAELIRFILMGNNRFINQNASTKALAAVAVHAKDSSNQSFTLKDGRTMGYGEYGDKKGNPVIGCHPVTGCRYQSHPNEKVTTDLGIRFIVPDRPGFGLSSPLHDRNFNDWAGDLEQLANHLKIDKFTMFGYCGGTPYAMACASNLAERVDKLVLVSPVTPYDKIDLLFGVKTPNRILVNIASHLPASIFQITNILARGLIRNPDSYFDEVIAKLCKTDASALNEPEMLENFQISLAESLTQGPKEFAYEQVLLANDWNIDVKTIKCNTQIWHGDEDKHVPIVFSKKFAKDFEQSEFNLLPGYGHFLIYHYWKDILKGIKN